MTLLAQRRAVIETLRKSGGDALASDVSKQVGIPLETLSTAIGSLVRGGEALTYGQKGKRRWRLMEARS